VQLLELHTKERAVNVVRVLTDPAQSVDLTLADSLVDADVLELVVNANDLLANVKFVAHVRISLTAGARRCIILQIFGILHDFLFDRVEGSRRRPRKSHARTPVTLAFIDQDNAGSAQSIDDGIQGIGSHPYSISPGTFHVSNGVDSNASLVGKRLLVHPDE
jgi:hypothetical protein